jgi:hypothetical protein
MTIPTRLRLISIAVLPVSGTTPPGAYRFGIVMRAAQTTAKTENFVFFMD